MRPIAEVKKNKYRHLWIIAAVSVVLLYLGGSLVALFTEPNEKTVIKVNKQLQGPVFSEAQGFYEKEFYLKISTQYPNATIYYTLDGSTPTTESMVFNGPILIRNRETDPNTISEIPNSKVWFSPLRKVFKGTVVKAIAVSGNSQTPETANVYFVHEKGRNRYSLPVVSLIVKFEDFFGYKNGIYVTGATRDDKDYYIRNNIDITDDFEAHPTNYKRRGMNWERAVNITLFEPEKNNGFRLNAGARIHGNATRERPQKALKFHLRPEYGTQILKYPLFGKEDRTGKYHAFMIRASGQDMYNTMFRDALMHDLLKETKLDVQNFRSSVVFINAEYWGIFNIRERNDAYYLANRYNIPLDSLAMLDRKLSPQIGDAQDSLDYAKLVKFALGNNLKEAKNFDQVAAQIDLENLIDYTIAEAYYGNSDWRNNTKPWRYKAKGKSDSLQHVRDGRWRYLVFDLDYGFGLSGSDKTNMFQYIRNNGFFGTILNGLLQNKTFREKLYARSEFHLNSTFKPEKVIARINEIQKTLAPEIPEHIDRWRSIGNVSKWNEEVEKLRVFARKRPDQYRAVLQKLKQEFKD